MNIDFNKILNTSDNFYVIGISNSNTNNHFHILELAYKNDNISISNKFSSSTFDETLFKNLKKDYPIILHFEGENIISKQVSNTLGYRNNILFKTNPDEFYFYEHHQENDVFVSLTRKDIVDSIMYKLNALDKFCVHVALGPFVLIHLKVLLSNETKFINTHYQLDIVNEKIKSFDKTVQKDYQYTIDKEVITIKETSLISAFLDYKFFSKTKALESPILLKNKEEFLYKKRFKTLGVFSLIFVLTSLFVGHHILNYYLKSLGEKESLFSISQQTFVEINDLKQQLNLKEKILQTSGIVNENYLTKYLYEIGESIPEAILISSISSNPIIKKVKPNERINFNFDTIEINGESKSDLSFNKWIKNLKTIPWVKKVEINDYSEDRTTMNSFFIKIKL